MLWKTTSTFSESRWSRSLPIPGFWLEAVLSTDEYNELAEFVVESDLHERYCIAFIKEQCAIHRGDDSRALASSADRREIGSQLRDMIFKWISENVVEESDGDYINVAGVEYTRDTTEIVSDSTE